MFEYTKPFTPELSDDNPIICAKFSPIRFEFYIAGGMNNISDLAEKSVKIWNSKVGKPVRELKNVMDSDITFLDFDDSHRKLIIGDHIGHVKFETSTVLHFIGFSIS